MMVGVCGEKGNEIELRKLDGCFPVCWGPKDWSQSLKDATELNSNTRLLCTVVVHICNPSPQNTDAEVLGFQGNLGYTGRLSDTWELGIELSWWSACLTPQVWSKTPHKTARHHTLVIPALENWRQEDQEFKTTVGYVTSQRPAWVTWDLS